MIIIILIIKINKLHVYEKHKGNHHVNYNNKLQKLTYTKHFCVFIIFIVANCAPL